MESTPLYSNAIRQTLYNLIDFAFGPRLALQLQFYLNKQHKLNLHQHYLTIRSHSNNEHLLWIFAITFSHCLHFFNFTFKKHRYLHKLSPKVRRYQYSDQLKLLLTMVIDVI